MTHNTTSWDVIAGLQILNDEAASWWRPIKIWNRQTMFTHELRCIVEDLIHEVRPRVDLHCVLVCWIPARRFKQQNTPQTEWRRRLLATSLCASTCASDAIFDGSRRRAHDRNFSSELPALQVKSSLPVETGKRQELVTGPTITDRIRRRLFIRLPNTWRQTCPI